MSTKFTVERVLREPEDASGQSVRAWTVTTEGDTFMITGGTGPDAWSPVSCRKADVEQLIADIRRAISASEDRP